MQVLTNEQFIAQKTRIGKYGSILGFAALVAGLIITLTVDTTNPASANGPIVVIIYFCLIYGFLGLNIGRYHSLRFGGKPRPDEILASALKGLDQKHVLFNYVEGLPGSHLLLSPLGLFFIELRIHDGTIRVEEDRWHRKWTFSKVFRSMIMGRFGNPTKDAKRGVERLKKYLAEKLDPTIAETVPIEAVIVFTDPTVELTTMDPTVPVVTPKDLRAQARSIQGREKMTGDVYRRLYDLLEADKARAWKENESRGRNYGRKNGNASRSSSRVHR